MFDLESIPEVYWHFDFDGTLFFTHAALLSAYEQSINEAGGEFLAQAKESMVRGESFRTFLKLCSWGDEEPDFNDIRDRKNELYLSDIDLIQPNTPLINIALSLAPNISIVTSSNRFVVLQILTAFNLLNVFSNIVSSDDVSDTKPSPEPYLKSMSAHPQAIHIAIEDSDLGITSAKQAGMMVLRVTDLVDID
jgi:beta-phosphoglucomutase-like phosphatase (HAD superfamily)